MYEKLLPNHGWIGCTRCYTSDAPSRLIGADLPAPWKIEKPNGAWGSSNPLVIVLGFSRGARQSKPLPYDQIAFNGMRPQLTKIMGALGLLQQNDDVSNHIRTTEKDFHFASLFRCSVSMWDPKEGEYSKSGNSILERFLGSKETCRVAENCTQQFLGVLPSRTKLILLLGNSNDYIEGCKSLFKKLYSDIRTFNPVAYTNNKVMWVHSIHAAAQGSYIPQWLAGGNSTIGSKLRPAQEAVVHSGVLPLLEG